MEHPIISREDAKQQNLRHFFTGIPCKNNHVSPRFVISRNCCACQREYLKQYYQTNKDTLDEKNKRWSEANPGKAREYQKKSVAKNPDYYKQKSKEWAKDNPGKALAILVRRRSLKKQAIPLWYDASRVSELHIKCREVSDITGVKHEVDHIVPINSKLVCGLHWHGNMEILTKSKNRSKSNKHWPDMSKMTPELRKLIDEFYKN